MTAVLKRGASTSARFESLKWLEGTIAPAIVGKRILLSTYNQSGYLAVDEDGEFMRRYLRVGDDLVVAPLDSISQAPEVQEWIHSVNAAIEALRAEGVIVQLPTPRQYEGAAVLYGLAH